LLLRAALDGQGAALLPRAFAEGELLEKRLIQLFAQPWPSSFAYYCLCPRAMADEPRVAAFRHWLAEEGRQRPSSDRTVVPRAKPDRARSSARGKRSSRAPAIPRRQITGR
jgi:hypothetical protein